MTQNLTVAPGALVVTPAAPPDIVATMRELYRAALVQMDAAALRE